MTRLVRVALLIAVTATLCGEAAAEIVFEGHSVFSRGQLLSALRRYDISLNGDFDVTDADDAAFFLREFYFTQGFRDADVSYRFTSAPSRAVFEISEGTRLFIGTVRFDGGEDIAADRLREIFNASIRQATRSPLGRLRYVETAIATATDQIHSTFVGNGFLDVTVHHEEEPGVKGTVNLNYQISQGRLYRISSVHVEGLDPGQTAAMTTSLQTFKDRIYRPGEEVLGQSRALDHLRNSGFYDAKATAEVLINRENGTVSLTINATPGPRYTIGEISIKGNKRTSTQAIRGRFGLKPGGIYNASAVDTGTRRLWFSGTFSDINQTAKPQPNHSLDLELEVTEGSAKQISGTLGYGEWDRAFGTLTYVDRNFLGTLNRLNLTGFLSQRSYGAGATLSAPYIFNSELTGYVGGFYAWRELPAYQATSLGMLVGIEQKALDSSQTGYSVRYEWKAITDSEVFANEKQNSLVDYNMGAIIWDQRIDKRNDPLIPMQGYMLSYEAAVASEALLGDISFLRLNCQATYYLPLRKITPEQPFVPFFIFNHRAGLILPYANTEQVPVPERFFLGGPDTVRSFQLDGLGPRGTDADPLGGQAFLQGNVEFQCPIWRNFYGAVFTDAGNLAPEIEDFDWDQTAVAVGAGLRFYTPIGALRMDYGYNLIRQDGDPIGALQFGFGFTF